MTQKINTESHLEKALILINEPAPFNRIEYLTEELAKFDYRDPFVWTLHKGRYKEAIQELELVLKENPKSIDANEYMGNLLVTLGRYSEALDYYQEAVSYGAETSIQLNIGALYEYLGERHKCFDHYRWAAHNPNLSLLSEFLLAFPYSELKIADNTLLEKIRNWINQYLDKEVPVKEEPSVQNPFKYIKRKITREGKCPLCGSMDSRLFYDDQTNHRKIRQCRECKLIYVSPQPNFSDIESWYGKQYFESSFEGANRQLGLWKQTYENQEPIFHPTGRQFSLIFQWLESLGLKKVESKLSDKLRMLDIGCATCGLMAEFITRGWDAYGVELSESAVHFDKEMGFNVIQGTVENSKFPDNYFDIITMTHVIEHLADPSATLKEVGRILRNKGKLVIRTPNCESLPRLIAGKEWFGDHDHLFFFGNGTLEAILKKCNFRIIGIKSYVGIDIETYCVKWNQLRLNDLIRARINQAELGDVILVYAEYQGD